MKMSLFVLALKSLPGPPTKRPIWPPVIVLPSAEVELPMVAPTVPSSMTPAWPLSVRVLSATLMLVAVAGSDTPQLAPAHPLSRTIPSPISKAPWANPTSVAELMWLPEIVQGPMVLADSG